MAIKRKKKSIAKKANGRPRAKIDYETLDRLCAIHCTGEECAAILGVDYDTLDRAIRRGKKAGNFAGFADYFKNKSAVGKMSLRRKQIEIALTGNPTMLIWMGKQQLAQKDKSDVSSEDGTMSPVSLIERVIVKNGGSDA